MPRQSNNNPTERILRLLDDFAQLEAAYDEALQAIAIKAPDVFKELSPKPTSYAIVEERKYQQVMGRTIATTRQRMQRLRQNPESRSRQEHQRTSNPPWQKPLCLDNLNIPTSLSHEQMEALAREMNQDSLKPEDLAEGIQLEVKKP